MNCEIIDIDTWSRGGLFRFYMDKMRIVMSLTVDVDVAPLVKYAKAHGLRFYPSMIWVVSKVVNSRAEFKYGWDAGGNLVRWESVSPSYADFHREDESFTKLVTAYSDDLFDFHGRYLRDAEASRALRGIAPDQPPNFFDVSCLPWVSYRHVNMHVFDEGRFLAPVVTWGRYSPDGRGGLSMPLTMNIHHAVADGFHLSRFFNEVQALINSLGG